MKNKMNMTIKELKELLMVKNVKKGVPNYEVTCEWCQERWFWGLTNGKEKFYCPNCEKEINHFIGWLVKNGIREVEEVEELSLEQKAELVEAECDRENKMVLSFYENS